MSAFRTRLASHLEAVWIRFLSVSAPSHSYGPLNLLANEYKGRALDPLWFEKVVRALSLIERVSPKTLARLYRDVDTLLIDEVRGPDFVRSARAIRLHGPTMHAQDTIWIALTIIHEATHARIASCGISYGDGQEERHERLCVRAEARFARRLPGGYAVADQLMEKLANPWWTAEARQARRLREFDRLGFTGPLGRAVRRHLERRRPRSND